jgi:hypothetical protein
MAEALATEGVHHRGDTPWWLAAPALQQAIAHQSSTPRATACYQLGEAVLHVASDAPELLDMFAQLYGDCAVLPPIPPDVLQVRCDVRRSVQQPLILLTFQAGAPPDPAAAALGPLRETPVAGPYTIYDSPLRGWRLARGAAQPVLAACGPYVLIDAQQVPLAFLVEYLVSITLAAQPRLLVLHAASLCIGDAGLLLAGPSHGGKTTTSLHLAARGHTLLGDETAVIRLATNEILPLRRTVNLRPGPRTPELWAVLGASGERAERAVGRRWLRPLRIGELFPDAPARPADLRAAFFLQGFAERAALTPCRLTLHDVEIFNCMGGNDTAYTAWGLSPERRALRLLAVRQMLARLPCWLLQVGTPVETAELIERTMEGLGC